MIRSKLFTLSRYLKHPGGRRQFSTTGAKLGGGGNLQYRVFPMAEKRFQIAADIAGGVMWWWILWHVFTDYGHIIGEFPFPDVCSWTDEELGIPADDAEE